jgi:hypothetical protein
LSGFLEQLHHLFSPPILGRIHFVSSNINERLQLFPLLQNFHINLRRLIRNHLQSLHKQVGLKRTCTFDQRRHHIDRIARIASRIKSRPHAVRCCFVRLIHSRVVYLGSVWLSDEVPGMMTNVRSPLYIRYPSCLAGNHIYLKSGLATGTTGSLVGRPLSSLRRLDAKASLDPLSNIQHRYVTWPLVAYQNSSDLA